MQRNGTKFPHRLFIDKRSDTIVTYWDSMHEIYPRRFSREINLALIGSPEKMPGWQDVAIERLREKCDHLIEVRGYDEWRLP